MNTLLEEYRSQIASDDGLKSKRRNLIMLSVVLIALNFSGAVIKEANTFLFKIEFTDQHGINELFFLSLCYLLLRYYTYAQQYHQRLTQFWCNDMFSDHKVFFFHPEDEVIDGLTSHCLQMWGGDEPGLRDTRYHISGVFKRSLIYSKEYADEEGELQYYDKVISCNKFNEKWTVLRYLALLGYEAKYQLRSYVKTREQLDLLGPYALGIFSLVLVVSKLSFWSLLPT
ncbi:hypothetical protein Q9X99_003719 [Vibrio cholerae]|nr:hypothetical protein [Vibrio cholerae]